ncbi:MAG TPA: DUF4129 domain-containing protein [Candidatus Acidoferrales bacterium]
MIRPARFLTALDWIALVVLFALSATVVAAQTNPPAPGPYESSPFDPPAFAAELNQLKTSLKPLHAQGSREDLAAFRTRLPVKWRVDTPDRSYEISSEPLRSILLDAERNPSARASHIEEAESWLGNLANQVQNYSSHISSPNLMARKELDEILRRREFSAIRPPNAWDRLKQRISDWLLRLIENLLHQIGRHPLGAKFLFWFLLAAAVAWIALMLFRYWGTRARMEEMQNIEHVAAHRSWQEWIRAARLAADAGNFREAVHSTYWAGITYLEDLGVVEPDRTRTPREYLRLVEESVGDLPSQRAQRRESLAVLTTRLERIWYGLRPARVEDFQDCMHQVEELGCRLP